jgi:hypothetical protein
MCVQVTKTTNRFEISSLLEKILLKQVRWCLIREIKMDIGESQGVFLSPVQG